MPDKNNPALCGALGMNNNSCNCSCGKHDNNCATCIDVDKIYDSAKDKDCIEDLKVFVNDCGQEIIDHATNIRCKSVEVLWAHITVSDIAFNRGHYSVNIRYYFKICFEACIPGGKIQEFCGIACYDKQCVLFGSEGNVSIFTSEPYGDDFCRECPDFTGDYKTNTPKVVLEVATPVCLGCKLVEKVYKYGYCCCIPEQIPEGVCRCCSCSPICEGTGIKSLYVSLGLFSLIRIERPVSLLIHATDYCIPDRESAGCTDSDPCTLFKSMNFPTSDFFPPNACQTQDKCGC